MKKLAIVGASAALAAMPVVGVFAADTTTSTDTINVEVASTCTFATEGSDLNKTVSFSLSAGESQADQTGSKFSVNCNDAGGWELKAKGGENGTNLVGSDAGSSKPIATGTKLSGATSAWGMKVTASSGVEEGGPQVQSGYDALHAVPSTDTVVVKSTAASSEASVSTSYSVYVAGDQPADTYTGTVVYTLSHPASAAGPGA